MDWQQKYDLLQKNFLLLIAPTFDTKATEYFSSGWVFFRQILTFYLAIFDGVFFIIQKVLLSWA